MLREPLLQLNTQSVLCGGSSSSTECLPGVWDKE